MSHHSDAVEKANGGLSPTLRFRWSIGDRPRPTLTFKSQLMANDVSRRNEYSHPTPKGSARPWVGAKRPPAGRVGRCPVYRPGLGLL